MARKQRPTRTPRRFGSKQPTRGTADRRRRIAESDPTLHIYKLGVDEAPTSIGAKAPKTIVYVHGIGNKPIASVLKCQWDVALFGTRLVTGAVWLTG